MNYYNRHWNETTAEELTNLWETSAFYFETDNNNNITRQIQLFKNGKALKYDLENSGDEFGRLADQPLDTADFCEFKITQSAFDNIWQQANK